MDAWSTTNGHSCAATHQPTLTNHVTNGDNSAETKATKDECDAASNEHCCCGMSRPPKWCPTFHSKKWEVFGQTTTLHGMRFVSNTKNHWLRRCIWLLLVTIMVCFLFFIVGFNVEHFLRFPISSIVRLQYVTNLTFPAVTICNYNQWRKSAVAPENLGDVSQLFFPSVRGNATFNITDYNVTGLNLTAEVLRGAHQKEKMIIDCTWKTVEKCSFLNFTQVITDFGVCYTFNNPEDPREALTVRQTGSEHGLFLRLNLELHEYFYGQRKGAGFKVMVHGQGEFPFVKQLGFSVAPGYESLVGLQKTKLINLPYPYISKCIGNEYLLPHLKYTTETCEKLCEVKYTVRYCGCKDYSMPGPFRVCNAEEVFNCVKGIHQRFLVEHPPCNCRVPCRREIYQPRVSESMWPAPHIAEQLTKAFNMTEDFLRRNFMDLVIYFEELNYQEIKQIPAYDWTTLLSDIGGYMGLLIGASGITILEFVDFAFDNLMEFVRKKRAAKKHQRSTTDSSMELV